MQNQIFWSLVERLKTLRSTIEDFISIFHFASSEVFNTNENLDDKKFLNDDGVMRFSIKVSNVKIYLTRAWTENNPASSESSNHPVFVVPGCCLILQQRLPRMKPRILVGIQPTDLCRLCHRKRYKVNEVRHQLLFSVGIFSSQKTLCIYARVNWVQFGKVFPTKRKYQRFPSLFYDWPLLKIEKNELGKCWRWPYQWRCRRLRCCRRRRTVRRPSIVGRNHRFNLEQQ